MDYDLMQNLSVKNMTKILMITKVLSLRRKGERVYINKCFVPNQNPL